MTHTHVTAIDLAPPAYYKNLRARLASYENSCLTRDYIHNLAATGIYREASDGYKCAFCSLYLKKLNARHLKYHTFSTCPMATRRLFENGTLRKESFRKFKTARIHYKDEHEQLANNGFYYYGKKVEIRCSHCQLVIVKLNKHDNAQHIHRRWSPECHFNKPSAPPLEKTESILENYEENYNNNVAGIYPHLPLFDDTIVNFVSVSPPPPSSSQSPSPRSESPPPFKIDDIMCKICFERERDTCFLPCRHVSTCSECAKRCKVCCICREKIKNKLEIFLQ